MQDGHPCSQAGSGLVCEEVVVYGPGVVGKQGACLSFYLLGREHKYKGLVSMDVRKEDSNEASITMHSVQTITPAAQQDSLSSRASKHASQEYHRLWSWYPEYLIGNERAAGQSVTFVLIENDQRL
ncbi:hypothetical protein TEQG_03796 [Trichophyton equinum CBS 127.97]|uniref:Uncharacterized protein n=1 Tax=Trichophyton equinum (strain ATCC MYA-4606 / CBS 127.97) TaxID=559882 RepID=F2PST3_TRIEC|nr:hypothetical protein TEQG_03796 [Trichophyton equinum CBS 127.97]